MFKNPDLPVRIIDRNYVNYTFPNGYSDLIDWVKDYPNTNLVIWQPMEWAPYHSSWGTDSNITVKKFQDIKHAFDSVGSELVWTFGSTDHAEDKMWSTIYDHIGSGHRDINTRQEIDNYGILAMDNDLMDTQLIAQHFTVTFDPYFFLHDAVGSIEDIITMDEDDSGAQPDFYNDMINNPISKVFTNLNRGPWIHRAQWIDQMAKYDLIDSNVVSWNQEYIRGQNGNYKFKHFDQKIINVDAMLPTGDSSGGFVLTDDHDHHFSYCRIPNESTDTLIDIITESSPMFYFYTEKTWKSVCKGRPFAIVGPKGINHWLQEQGFQLYNEIIDYSYDLLDTQEERNEHLAKQLKALEQADLKALQISVADKLLHNAALAIQIWTDNNDNIHNDPIRAGLHDDDSVIYTWKYESEERLAHHLHCGHHDPVMAGRAQAGLKLIQAFVHLLKQKG